MASVSAIGALQDLYDTLSFATKPAKLWVDGVPIKDSTTATNLPTAELLDLGMTVDYDFEQHPIEKTTVNVIIRATTLFAADTIAAGIRYNGSAPTANAGFDFATLATFPLTGQTLLECMRVGEQRNREPYDSKTGDPVYRVTMTYEITPLRTA